MRSIIALALLACVSVSASAASNPDRVPTRVRDCLRGEEIGIPAPTSNLPTPIYMYVTSVMFKGKDRKYGSVVSWQTTGSFKQACDVALADANKQLAGTDATITGSIATLVPDSVLKRAVAH